MFIKLCNLGRDAEVKYTQGGKAVASLTFAYSIGFGEQKRTQWIEASLWGERTEKMSAHLKKGTKLLLTADDLEVEVFDKRDGSQGAKLKGRVVNLEFAGSRQDNHEQGKLNQPSPVNKTQRSSGGWDNDIPFMRLHTIEGG